MQTQARWTSRVVAFGVVGALVFACVGLARGYRSAHADAPPFSNCDINTQLLPMSAEETTLLALINQYRASNNATALQPDYLLTRLAIWKATNLAQTASFATTPPSNDDAFRTWQQRFADCGYLEVFPDQYIGEDITAGYATAADTFASLLNSPTDAANLLSPNFLYVGIKHMQSQRANDRYQDYWVVSFGGALSQDLNAVLAGQPFPTIPGQ